jgi:hypothetical protein
MNEKYNTCKQIFLWALTQLVCFNLFFIKQIIDKNNDKLIFFLIISQMSSFVL